MRCCHFTNSLHAEAASIGTVIQECMFFYFIFLLLLLVILLYCFDIALSFYCPTAKPQTVFFAKTRVIANF